MTPRVRAATGKVLVVGATGILRPAVAQLLAEGATVYAVARSVPDPATPRFVPVPADATAATFADRIADLTHGSLTGALVYAPTTTRGIVEQLAQFTPRVVWILTSRVAAPTSPGQERWNVSDLGPVPDGVVRLVLGWRPDGTWHDAEEISAAALSCLSSGGDSVLGRVRPWSYRPS